MRKPQPAPPAWYPHRSWSDDPGDFWHVPDEVRADYAAQPPMGLDAAASLGSSRFLWTLRDEQSADSWRSAGFLVAEFRDPVPVGQWGEESPRMTFKMGYRAQLPGDLLIAARLKQHLDALDAARRLIAEREAVAADTVTCQACGDTCSARAHSRTTQLGVFVLCDPCTALVPDGVQRALRARRTVDGRTRGEALDALLFPAAR